MAQGPKTKTVLSAVERLLTQEGRPIHYREITDQIIQRGFWRTKGQTPDRTVNATLSQDIDLKGRSSVFMRTDRGIFALRQWENKYSEYDPLIREGAFVITELTMQNFRCFTNQTISIPQEFTVLVGNNGAGKTAILDALKIGVGAYLSGLNIESPPIGSEQVRRAAYMKGETLTFEPQYPVLVSCKGGFDDQAISWERGRRASGSTSYQNTNELVDLAKLLQSQVHKGMDTVLPVIAYYGIGRTWNAPQIRQLDTYPSGSRFRGYDDCLIAESHITWFIRWIKTQEINIIKKKQQVGKVLEAVKIAMRNCVRDLQDISYDFDIEDIIVIFSDKRKLPFQLLSEGIRNMLATVADIAYRSAVLNPQLEEGVTQKTPGIVLIDEIDLHLHPKWQQRVIGDLRRTFPKMQFITTTHSPFIVASVPSEQILWCQPKSDHCIVSDAPGEYNAKPVDEILASPLFEETRPFNEEISLLLEKRKLAIEQGEHNKRQQIETKLKALNPSYFSYFDVDKLLEEIAGAG